MITQSPIFECPDCESSELHYEADYSYGSLLSRICSQIDEIVSTEPDWCYCLNCGLMFDPVSGVSLIST